MSPTAAIRFRPALFLLLVAGCGSGGSTQGSSKTRGATITVALASEPPPKSALAAFTKQTGIKVKWVNIDWDSLQTKITAAATAKTYFADATDVDWSRVGQLAKLKAFYPMSEYVYTKSMAPDMPNTTRLRRAICRRPVLRSSQSLTIPPAVSPNTPAKNTPDANNADCFKSIL